MPGKGVEANKDARKTLNGALAEAGVEMKSMRTRI